MQSVGLFEIARGYVGRAGTMISAMVVVSILLAVILVGLELVSPTYSGFGPLRPMVEATTVVLVLSCVMLLIEAIATLLPWGKSAPRAQLIVAGAVCALGASQPLIGRVSYPIFGSVPPELLVVSAAIVCAGVLRCYRSRVSA